MRVTPAAGPRLRIGCVQYLNARPLIDGWQGDVHYDHPAALCESLAAGELDVALVSSFEFLRAPIYTIVDGIAIASDGPVFSVFLAHAGELHAIEQIELDPTSRTSVNLLRCVLAHFDFHPAFASEPAPISPDTGRLLIGDQAIRFRQEHGNAYRYLDLGEQWRQITGLPFVYALWLIRPEVAHAEAIARKLRDLRDANAERIEMLAAHQVGFRVEFCRFYWRDCLKFGFGESEKLGLRKFQSLCAQHGILKPSEAPLRLA